VETEVGELVGQTVTDLVVVEEHINLEETDLVEIKVVEVELVILILG
jgi:hypothetical protein